MIDKELLKTYAQEINIPLNSNALEHFDIYASELVAWNEKINLTAIVQPQDIVIKHFLDSLWLLKHADVPRAAKMIDVGTGAGFPGLPLLIARNDLDITLMDSLNKRLVFLEKVLNKCALSAELVHSRAEELGQNERYREKYDIAAARAVAPMNVLSEYCLPFVKVGGVFAALKGSADETDSAENAVKALGGEIIDNVSYKLPNGDKRSIVIVKKISQTLTEYPRKNKKITARPL